MWNRRFFKTFCILLALIILSFSFSACQQNRGDSEQKSPSFTDAFGRTVTLTRRPKRVAALLGSFADLWLLSGGTLCAVTDDAEEDFGIETKGLIRLGGAHSPSLEQLLSASPDLVLASAKTPAHVNLCESLERAGITVAYFDVDSFDGYLSMLKFCTEQTGQADAYETYGTNLKSKIERIKSDFQSKNLSDREKTVLVLRISSGLVKVKSSSGTVLGEMLEDLGCINLADRDKALTEQLNVEYILEQNPHHILVVTMGDEEKAKKNFNTMMEENPAWSSLEAVREGRMHVLHKHLFNQKPNARWATAYETLAQLLAP